METENLLPHYRAEGVTSSERYLMKLCERSFLRLWSFAGLYRDQGKTTMQADGKELCDLLVVFGNHIIIFSDKDCVFPQSGNLALDWSRWYKRTILDGAKQIWGAERWIKTSPASICLDRACKQPFPFELPNADDAIIHRIVVAHGASERCKQELGGSGSLLIDPSIIGDAHSLRRGEGGFPFAVGFVDKTRGFVHVFDDTSLSIVMNTRDTITDFVEYLSAKEEFIASGILGMAVGEEELLGYYLKDVNEAGKHYFKVPEEDAALIFDEGHWEYFANSPERQAQIAANEISYVWDRLIETFSKNVIGATLYHTTHPGLSDQSRLLSLLAKEPRTQRRALAEALIELVSNTPSDKKAARLIVPTRMGDTHFVFLAFPYRDDITHDENREVRKNALWAYCRVAKAIRPEAQQIVGIATEAGGNRGRSEDLMYMDVSDWTAEDQVQALGLQRDLDIFQRPRMSQRHVEEYPIVNTSLRPNSITKRKAPGPNPRNKLCPCGSGLKYKRCCGR
jgi:hypothetical protein